MFELMLKNRGGNSGDANPTVLISALKKQGIAIPSGLKQGDRFVINLTPYRGRVPRLVEFRVNRANLTTAMAVDWAKENLLIPANGPGLKTKCHGVTF